MSLFYNYIASLEQNKWNLNHYHLENVVAGLAFPNELELQYIKKKHKPEKATINYDMKWAFNIFFYIYIYIFLFYRFPEHLGKKILIPVYQIF